MKNIGIHNILSNVMTIENVMMGMMCMCNRQRRM